MFVHFQLISHEHGPAGAILDNVLTPFAHSTTNMFALHPTPATEEKSGADDWIEQQLAARRELSGLSESDRSAFPLFFSGY